MNTDRSRKFRGNTATRYATLIKGTSPNDACTDLAMERLSVPVNFGNLHTTINDLLHFFAQSQLPEYKPIAQAEKTDCIRFVHGTADDTVNPQDSVDMYNLAQNPKDMFFIEGASHGADGHEAEFLEAIVSWFALQF